MALPKSFVVLLMVCSMNLVAADYMTEEDWRNVKILEIKKRIADHDEVYTALGNEKIFHASKDCYGNYYAFTETHDKTNIMFISLPRVLFDFLKKQAEQQE
ncbi:MAG: hypothetical protein AB7R69_01645 [Candidatus Babeliales bacterium]